MASRVKAFFEKGYIKNIPSFVKETHYETIMGSVAYGVSNDMSDVDVYGFTIPSKDIVFPHLAGHIQGFGKKPQSFDQWQQHHIKVEEKGHEREYDFQIFNIVKFFQLVMENNPNMIDSLYTPNSCVLHQSKIGQMVRSNRNIFLHKGSWQKFKGYSYSQLNKAKSKNPIGKRKEVIEKFGYDVKFAYHVVRLIDEVEQIFTHGTIDLQRAQEHLKAIRRGDVSLEEIEKWFSDKELALEKLYHESTAVPYSPDEDKIKQLLLDSLEEYYGNLESSVVKVDKAEQVIKDIVERIKQAGY